MRSNPDGLSPSDRLLLLEDDPDDARFVEMELEQCAPRQFAITWMERLSDALDRLTGDHFDVVLCDLGLPDSRGLDTVRTIRERAPANLPIVVLTGLEDDAIGREAIKCGTQDYLVKERLDGSQLTRSLRYAIERKRLETELREANETLTRRIAERTVELEAANAILRANAARDSAMMQAAHAGIVTLDDKGRILTWNPAAERMFGYMEVEVLGQPLAMLMPQRHRAPHAAGPPGVKIGRGRRAAGGTVELEGLNKDGREFPIELSYSEWKTAEGRFVTGMIHDISERRRAQQALTRQRDLYDALWRTNAAIARSENPEELFERVCRIVVENGRFLFAWVGLVGTGTRWLTKAARYGVDAGYFEVRRAMMRRRNVQNTGLAFHAVTSGERAVANDFLNHPATALWHKAARERGVRAFASFPLRRSGEVVGALNIYADALGAFTDEVVATLDSMALDVSRALDGFQRETERRRSEQALRESEERFRRLFEDAPIGVAMVDLDDRSFIRANASYCAMFGYREEELKRLTFLDLTHPDERARDAAVSDRARARKGAVYQVEKRYLKKSGEILWARLMVSNVMNDRGEPLCALAMVEDISERNRLERAMRAFPQQIIAAQEEEKRNISSALHHDIGSLAVGVSAYLDAVEIDLRNGRRADALAGVPRVRKLFEGTIARLKEMAVRLRPVELDLLGLRAALRQLFTRVTRTGKATVEFADAMGRQAVPPAVATALFRIAQEALNNAIAHGHATRVGVRLGSSRHGITMRIRDNGSGFDSVAIAARKTPRMGLRVMREMAVAVGGEFAVASSPGKGCTLRVSVPRAAAAAGAATKRVRTPRRSARSRRLEGPR